MTLYPTDVTLFPITLFLIIATLYFISAIPISHNDFIAHNVALNCTFVALFLLSHNYRFYFLI